MSNELVVEQQSFLSAVVQINGLLALWNQELCVYLSFNFDGRCCFKVHDQILGIDIRLLREVIKDFARDVAI